MSKISIPGCVSDLLFERNQIVLPSIGLFETKIKESAVDQVQGMIHPPSKEITFNANVTGDDGVLVDFIKKKYSVEEMPARTALAEFTNDLRLRIHQKEIISIPDVGRLYLDFEKNMQFLPDRVNYNKDAFGLPSLNYYPVMQEETPPAIISQPAPAPTPPIIVKREEPVIPPTPAPVAEPTPVQTPTPVATPAPSVEKPAIAPQVASNSLNNIPPVKPDVPETVIPASPNADSFQGENGTFVSLLAKVAPFLLVFALLFVCFIFYKFLFADSTADLPQDKLAEIEGRVNKKPSFNDDQTAVYEDEAIMDQTNEGMSDDYDDENFEDEPYNDDYDENTEVESDPVIEEEYEEPSRISRGGKSGIIIIGGFSSAQNAQKLVEKIQRKGYSPYTDAKGSLTRVGVEFNFDTVSELDDTHRQIKREFNDRAWILQPK